jgi:hypothetical protein
LCVSSSTSCGGSEWTFEAGRGSRASAALERLAPCFRATPVLSLLQPLTEFGRFSLTPLPFAELLQVKAPALRPGAFFMSSETVRIWMPAHEMSCYFTPKGTE